MNRKPDSQVREAARRHIPLKGWWQIVKRVGSKIVSDNLQVVTAGCAFYALFAIFPALWASISLFGLTTDPDTVERQFGMLATVLPPQAYDIVIGEIRRIAETPHQALGWGFAVGLGIALWSANLGTQAMFSAHAAYRPLFHNQRWYWLLAFRHPLSPPVQWFPSGLVQVGPKRPLSFALPTAHSSHATRSG